jgi:hypothetical protein
MQLKGYTAPPYGPKQHMSAFLLLSQAQMLPGPNTTITVM